MFRGILTLLTVLGLSLFGSTAFAADTPDATLKLSQGTFGVGIGFSWGEGTLTYKGQEYTFKVDGLSLGDVGITKSEASGTVYNLAKLDDFNGNYTSASTGGTLAGGGAIAAMKNQNGVVIHLGSTTKGLNIKLAVDGVKFTLKDATKTQG